MHESCLMPLSTTLLYAGVLSAHAPAIPTPILRLTTSIFPEVDFQSQSSLTGYCEEQRPQIKYRIFFNPEVLATISTGHCFIWLISTLVM